MEHSPKYEMVRGFYMNNLWEERKVRDAVIKHWITEEEFKEITGKDY